MTVNSLFTISGWLSDVSFQN